MAVTQLGIQGHEFHFSGSPLMSTLLTGLSYLLIFTIMPVLTFKVVSKINPYLSRKFPASKEETEHLDYLLSEENPKRDIYERYALIEVGIFIVPLSVFLVILTVWPFTVLQNASSAITLFHVSVSAIILAFPALFLAAGLAASLSNYAIRLIYKFFNPDEDSSVLYFTSRIMIAEPSGFGSDYHPTSANRFMLILAILIYPVFAYTAYARIDVLTDTHFHDNSILMDRQYDVNKLTYKIYDHNKTSYLRITRQADQSVLLDSNIRMGEFEDLERFLISIGKLKKISSVQSSQPHTTGIRETSTLNRKIEDN